MSRLTAGSKMPDFSYETPFSKKENLSDTVKKVKGKTAVIFLRYYGCTLCQFDIHNYIKGYDEIKKTGGQILVALQSDPALVHEQIKDQSVPFEIICDKDQKLYREFDIRPAESMENMIDEKGKEKIVQATAAGFKHGEYEGNELQLPAVFVIDAERNLTYVHYSETASDVPTSEELVGLLQ